MQTTGEGPDEGHAIEQHTDGHPHEGFSRRGLMRGAAGVGAATVAAGLLATAMAEPATAAQPTATTGNDTGAAGTEPIVAHVRDARTGEVDLFVATRHVRVRDLDLAARLARATR